MYFNSLINICYNIFGDNMKCPKCNAEYKTNLKFCPKCGEVFESKVVGSDVGCNPLLRITASKSRTVGSIFGSYKTTIYG